MANWAIKNNFEWKEIFIPKMHLKMLSVKWWPFCAGLNVLKRLLMKYMVHMMTLMPEAGIHDIDK